MPTIYDDLYKHANTGYGSMMFSDKVAFDQKVEAGKISLYNMKGDIKMYQVFDNNKPADCFHCTVDRSWDNSKFANINDAQDYARRWLDSFDSVCPLTVGVPVSYDGYGDVIEIREVQ